MTRFSIQWDMLIYTGTFFIAFTTLALEITLARLLSVTSWYYLAFFAISTAMLGMTAGAATVYLKPGWFTGDKLSKNLSKFCLAYSLVIPLTLIVLCLIPLSVSSSSVMNVTAMLVTTAACSLPFYFSGIVVTALLTKYNLPIGKLYGSDLIGASAGCLFVLGGLDIFDAPSLILLCSAVGAAAGLFFARHASTSRLRRVHAAFFIIFSLAAVINTSSMNGIRPVFVKGRFENFKEFQLERWNSFSRVIVYKKARGLPQLWGPSPLTPKQKIVKRSMNIDGLAGTTMRKFTAPEDIHHLRYDVTNIGYYLRSGGGACIIGAGGGRDIQSAVYFGHEKITGIDVNPIFINLLKGEFKEFAGVADRPGVTLIADEARSYLSRSKENFSIIQMSLIDTWAATGAGAFSLSENALYTIEAWQVFLERLKQDGIFTVSRWHSSRNLGETGRIVSLAVASLLRSGKTNPAGHIAMITTKRISTLLLSKQPFSQEDIAKLKSVCEELKFNMAILPGRPPENKILRKIVSAASLEELNRAIAKEPLNYEPPTDENPYFFNMLRLNNLGVAARGHPGVLKGNLVAVLTLVKLIFSLLLIAVATIVVPLFVKSISDRTWKQSHGTLWPGALYFSLIGAGFMFVEIGLIQRLSVFLGHPVYALGIVLFTVIASTGIGSLVSEKLPLTRFPWIFVYPVVMVLAIIIVRLVLPVLLSGMITSPMPHKIAASIVIIFPPGGLLGLFFPTGMRIVREFSSADTPWFWALNGIFGVLCSAAAVLISIHFGISTNFHIAAICYALLLVSLYYMYRLGKKHKEQSQ